MMPYPTLECVEAADAVQLLRWHRFLPVAGLSAVESNNRELNAAIKRENDILDRIKERLDALGGIGPEISRAVGWSPPGLGEE